MTSESQNSSALIDDEIDAKEMLTLLFARKMLIARVTVLAAILSVAVALLIPNEYTATAKLAPTEQSQGGLSDLMSQYQGLASLAGVSIPGGGKKASRAQLAIEVMHSRGFLGDFVTRRNLLPDLFALEKWDPQNGKVVYDKDKYDADKHEWLRAEPSLWEAYKRLRSITTISQDVKTGYVTVSIEYYSPVLASQWVSWLVQDVNAVLRDQDVEEATRAIEYLKQQVTNTALADLQSMFFELIQKQTERMMLTQIRPEYAFKTIDPPLVPEEKTYPYRALICVLGTMLGIFAGVGFVLLERYLIAGYRELDIAGKK